MTTCGRGMFYSPQENWKPSPGIWLRCLIGSDDSRELGTQVYKKP